MPRFAANLSMLFTEVDFLDRFALAARAGFRGVECQFPYDYDAHELRAQLDQHHLELVLFNLPPGDWAAGERGIACLPDRVDDFRASVEQAIAYAQVLGNRQVNCLAGIKPQGYDDDTLASTLIANLRYAAERLAKAGITLVMEPLNTRDTPNFYLNHTRQALAIKARVGHPNLFIQYDIYHMQVMEGDLATTLSSHLADIHHIQLADNPGRHEPGTGEINYPFLLAHLDNIGYQGWVSCEYKPATTTEAGLGWLRTFNVN